MLSAKECWRDKSLDLNGVISTMFDALVSRVYEPFVKRGSK